jgi:hypothetical protein
VTLIVVFPQRGYRIKPTNNQKMRIVTVHHLLAFAQITSTASD